VKRFWEDSIPNKIYLQRYYACIPAMFNLRKRRTRSSVPRPRPIKYDLDLIWQAGVS
jgi:hypothetical protein